MLQKGLKILGGEVLKLRKALITLLAFLLVFSNGVLSVGAAGNYNVTPKEDLLNQKPVETSETVDLDQYDGLYEADEEVRIIVEVSGDPAIKYATDQGVKFADLPKTKQSELQNAAYAKQLTVKQQIEKLNVNMKYEQEFATVFNGFSGFVDFGQLEVIGNLSGVTNVWIATEYERPDVTPEMIYSKDIVEAQRTWDDYGYDGEGMIVGVIDSGVDPDHRDFILTDEEAGALSEADVNEYVDSEGLPGKYYSPKVPYGYNYMDESYEIRDLGPGASEHGMHVSGTVGANGDEDNGGIKGVAPEAQILGLKVFGNDPEMGSTWGDIYIRAIEDSIVLGADVINMSLGSTAAFVDHDNPENVAIENAIDHGIVMSISAGNSAHLGYGFFNPYAEHPDYGVVGSPGMSTNALQVASIDNSNVNADAIDYTVNGEASEGVIAYMSQGNVDPTIGDEEFELVYAALGGEEDFEGMDLTGKYALVQRGEHAFADKALNAQAAGAEGIFIYNNEDGLLNMATEPEVVIPQLFMLKSDGDYLADLLQAGEEVTVSFQGSETSIQNPTNDQLSEFTSKGLAPNLDFKPEITAPGGSILSTFQNDSYGMMSGTSMAAPHVSGGSALILQRIAEEFGLEGKDRVQLAKNILMSTANPVVEKGAFNQALGSNYNSPYYSPRTQGAGSMKLHAAVSTPAMVTEVESGQPKVALKEVGDQFSFSLEITNFSDEELEYVPEVNAQTDLVLLGFMGNLPLTGQPDQLESVTLEGAEFVVNGGADVITVPADSAVTVDVQVDVSNANVITMTSDGFTAMAAPEDLMENGYFVEGFVTFTDPNDNNPQLSVPYSGFNGDWNDAPILDELAYDGNDSFYEQAGAVFESTPGNYSYLGYEPFSETRLTEHIAISPQTDSAQDRIIPLLSYLRNAKDVEYNVLDEDGNVLRKLRTEKNIRKNYFDRGLNPPYRLAPAVNWDGTINGEVAEEGLYYLEIKATIDYPGKEAQSFKIPVQVDVTAPELDVELDGTELAIDASDEGSGLKYLEILLDGESLGIIPPTETSFDFGEELPEGTSIAVVAGDFAGNETEVLVSGINDNEGPVIYVDTPGTFTVFDTSEIRVAGKVTDASEVVEFKIQDEDVELTWVEEAGHYVFDTVISLEDGEHPIKLYAKDAAGNETQLANSRVVVVDTVPPVIDLGDVPTTVSKGTDSIELTATLSDNFEQLRYYINDNEVFYNGSDAYAPYSVDVTEEVSLEYGQNVFTLKLVDLAGHTTIEEVTIVRERLDRIKGTSRYDTAVEISKAGWDSADSVILARGDDFADALAGVPLAKKLDAPLLLSRTEGLPDVTLEEIERLGAETVYVLGGDIAISAEVKNKLTEEGYEVINVKGSSREATAVEIAKLVVGDDEVDTAVIVNRADFPDALSVASHAADKGYPILLTGTDSLNADTAAALDELGISNTYVIGGSLAISDDVVAELPNPERIKGSNRYETSVAIAEHFDVDTTEYFVATGKEFPDALAGAALAAKKDTGILLVKDSVSEDLAEFITNKGLKSISVFGGELAVNKEILEELAELLE